MHGVYRPESRGAGQSRTSSGPTERVRTFSAASQVFTLSQKLPSSWSAVGPADKNSKLRHTWARMQSSVFQPSALNGNFVTTAS